MSPWSWYVAGLGVSKVQLRFLPRPTFTHDDVLSLQDNTVTKILPSSFGELGTTSVPDMGTLISVLVLHWP